MNMIRYAPGQKLNTQHGVALNICAAAALRRGIIDETEAGRLGVAVRQSSAGLTLSGPVRWREASSPAIGGAVLRNVLHLSFPPRRTVALHRS